MNILHQIFYAYLAQICPLTGYFFQTLLYIREISITAHFMIKFCNSALLLFCNTVMKIN